MQCGELRSPETVRLCGKKRCSAVPERQEGACYCVVKVITEGTASCEWLVQCYESVVSLCNCVSVYVPVCVVFSQRISACAVNTQEEKFWVSCVMLSDITSGLALCSASLVIYIAHFNQHFEDFPNHEDLYTVRCPFLMPCGAMFSSVLCGKKHL